MLISSSSVVRRPLFFVLYLFVVILILLVDEGHVAYCFSPLKSTLSSSLSSRLRGRRTSAVLPEYYYRTKIIPTILGQRQPRRRDESFSVAPVLSSSSSNNERDVAAAAAVAPPPAAPPRKQQQQQPQPQQSQELSADQLDFTLGYLNKHHGTLLRKFAETYTAVGEEMAKANAFSGRSYSIESAEIVYIDTVTVKLQVNVQRRNRPAVETKTVEFPLNATNPMLGGRRRSLRSTPAVPDNEDRTPLDEIVRRLCRLCWMVGEPSVTGKLIQLAIQLQQRDEDSDDLSAAAAAATAAVGKLPENLYLNQVPHNRYVRQFFYDTAAQAVLDAVIECSLHKRSNRMKVCGLFPEMNPAMDSYRIGTILEMARAITIRLAEENVRVRLCVQGSMGVGIFTGVPKNLNGVSRLIQLMDWQSGAGEENDGMVGDYVNFGAVGPDHVTNEVRDVETGDILQHQDDAFVIIAPQSMVGTDSSIVPLLQGMVAAAGDRPVILINPDLSDKVSAAGQQSVRGRKERMEFADSFETVYHFQNIYVSGTSYFPILGAMTKMHPSHPWVAHQRRDYAGGGGEIYVPVLAGEEMPSGQDILESFDR